MNVFIGAILFGMTYTIVTFAIAQIDAYKTKKRKVAHLAKVT